MNRCRVVVADDKRKLADEIAESLALEDDIEVVGIVYDGLAALERVRETLPDVVLMDLDMPGMDGVEATRRIKEEMPSVEVTAWTVLEESANLYEALRAGAKGYLLKHATNEEIADAVRALARGEAAIPPPLVTHLRNEFERIANQGEALRQLYKLLTRQEAEVLTCIGRREKNRQIAQRLFITEDTAKKHVRSILSKLDVNSRVEAALIAQKSGLLDHRESR